jgi:hypothetical protein
MAVHKKTRLDPPKMPMALIFYKYAGHVGIDQA